jgi:hypothetical protein
MIINIIIIIIDYLFTDFLTGIFCKLVYICKLLNKKLKSSRKQNATLLLGSIILYIES